MIVGNLMGGLGNQLFQFACAWALARRHASPLRVSTDLFDSYGLHQGYELDRVFAIQPEVASEADLQALLGPWRRPTLRRALARLRPGVWRAGHAVFEAGIDHWPGLDHVGANAYLHGYWQSESYFAEARGPLRALLQFRQPLSPANAAWLGRIEGRLSVSLHVRRGDYVTSAKNRSIYAACTPQYYRAAMDRLLAVHPQAHFYAFSDDPSWVREILSDRLDRVDIVDHNRGADSHNDLRLMSRCQHHVIANSTFSWWAAWLGERPGKIVIAPRQWFVDPQRGRDIVPARWLRL